MSNLLKAKRQKRQEDKKTEKRQNKKTKKRPKKQEDKVTKTGTRYPLKALTKLYSDTKRC